MFLHTTSTSVAGGAERLILEGSMILILYEFRVVEKNSIMAHGPSLLSSCKYVNREKLAN